MNSVQKTLERNKKIKEVEAVIKDMKELTYDEIAELTGIKRATVCAYVKDISDNNDAVVIESNYGRGKGVKNVIRWIDNPTTDKEEEKPMSDPTATVAMNNMQPNAGKFKDPVKPGDIWWIDSNPSFMALILSVNKANSQILMIKEKDNYFDPETDMTVAINDQEFYIQPYRVMSRGTRTFISKAATFGNDRLAKVLQAVGYYLCIPPVFKEKIVEVPVEKIVEKTVEVPVEKVVEVSVPADEVLRYKAEMWDRFVDRIISSQV